MNRIVSEVMPDRSVLCLSIVQVDKQRCPFGSKRLKGSGYLTGVIDRDVRARRIVGEEDSIV